MKKFIINLFSNRFGIVLATLNVCYFASIGFRPFIVSAKYLICLNLPAALLTTLSVIITKIFVPQLSYSGQMIFGNILFTFFMILQWLLIAWLAKTIAQKFRPKEL